MYCMINKLVEITADPYFTAAGVSFKRHKLPLGVRLGPGSRENFMTSDQIGRSDSQGGRSGSARLQHFSLNFKEK